MVLLLKNLIFILIVPASMTIYFPYLVYRYLPLNTGMIPDLIRWIAAIPILIGATILLTCIAEFAFRGRATPAPIDAPKKLVISGFYRFVRNPMYVGVVVLLLGEVVFFDSIGLLFYLAFAWMMLNLFVITYEEPTLLRSFGDEYREYCKQVGRWIPSWPRYTSE